MNNRGKLIAILCIAAVLLFCGCVGNNETKTNTTQTNTTQSTQTSTTLTPSTAPQSAVRYVQLNFLGGTSTGGEYVSESAAFTTIKLMYTLDPSAIMQIYNEDLNGSVYRNVKATGYITKENGNTVSFKNALVNTMADIPDPTAFIEKTLQEIKDGQASDKRARELRFGKAQ